MEEKSKILLVDLAGIGDAILSIPAIRNLRRCLPWAYIGYLTLPGPAQLISNSAYVDEVFVLSKNITHMIDNLRTILRLRRYRFDIALNLYQLYTVKGALLIATLLVLIKAKRTIGRDTDGKGIFYDVKIEDFLNAERHDVEYKLDLIRAVGCEVKDNFLELWLNEYDNQAVKNFLEEKEVSDSDILIGINPDARRPSRRWDWKNFAYVADELAKRHKAKIIITGSKPDSGLAKRISQKMSVQPIDTSGRFSLTQAVALIKRCHLYITNDTAPMHIANALKIPMVAIMGPGTVKTTPYQKENCIILRKDVKCAPCYKFRCWSMRCLKNITVDMVIDASEKLLMTR